MKLVTYASPSHKEMCNRFVLANAEKAGFAECVLYEASQQCPTGDYNSPGFADAMVGKVECLASISIGDRICYIDADCLIMPGLADWCDAWLSSHLETIGHGDDGRQLCAGTLVFEQTTATAEWWRFLRMLTWTLGTHDQNALNALASIAKRLPVSLDYLDNSIFANWATHGELSQKYWLGEELIVPASCLCWHANFCIGVEKKVQMLEIVERQLTMVSL